MQKIISLSVARNYVSDWDFWEMVREFVQNALDNQGTITYLSDSIIISNPGKIQMSSLLYGGGTKQEDETKIGKHGEGMKNALLVAVRSGRNITVVNDDELWIPFFKHDPSFGTETLCVEIVPIESTGSVCITLENISPEEIELSKERCITPTEVPPIVFGSETEGYAFEPESEPMLYVGGLYVSEMPKAWYESKTYRYSYNLPPRLVHLDRDRNSVNDYDIQEIISKILIANNEIDLLLSLGYDEHLDVEGYTEYRANTYYSGSYSKEKLSDVLATKALAIFYEKHGDNAYPLSDGMSKLKQRHMLVIEAGFQPVTVPSKVYSYYKKEEINSYGIHEPQPFNACAFLEELLSCKTYSLRGVARKKVEAKLAYLTKYNPE